MKRVEMARYGHAVMSFLEVVSPGIPIIPIIVIM